MNERMWLLAGSAFVWGLPAGAAAQTPDAQVVAPSAPSEDNAVTQASDAFGRQVGREQTGLYSSSGIRGFDPGDAGNLRINSLYFDPVDRLPGLLVAGSTVRVGFGALGYAFPAPTGLVDHSLNLPSDDASLTVDLSSYHYGNLGGSIEVELPLLAGQLGVFGGVEFRRRDEGDGRRYQTNGQSLLIAANPWAGAEVIAFGALRSVSGEEARPIYFSDGSALPPRIKRRVDFSQPWTDRSRDMRTIGLMVSLPVLGFAVETGIFSDQKIEHYRFSDQFVGVRSNGSVAERTITGDVESRDRSHSGELRLVKELSGAGMRHRLSLSLRGRNRTRLFGGEQRFSLGESTVLRPDIREKPAFAFRPKNADRISQVFYGASYSGSFGNWLLVDLSLSKTNYRKRTDYADPARPDTLNRDNPLLWNASVAASPIPGISLLVGMAHGMEEAGASPSRAVNPSEAPAAIRTRQEEAGIRYSIEGKFAAVVGVFRISKPYYNLDPVLFYRELGTIVNEGLELSLLLNAIPGLNILGGAVLSNPTIDGEAVDAGLIGRRPIGQARQTMIANIDWRPRSGLSDWSFDFGVSYSGSRIGNAANSLQVPSSTTIDVGFRRRFALDEIRLSLRGRVDNLLNAYNWQVTPNGGFNYSSPRTFSLQLVADF